MARSAARGRARPVRRGTTRYLPFAVPTIDPVPRAAISTACLFAIALLALHPSLSASADAPDDGSSLVRVRVQPADTVLARLQAEIASLVGRFGGDAGMAEINVETFLGVAA